MPKRQLVQWPLHCTAAALLASAALLPVLPKQALAAASTDHQTAADDMARLVLQPEALAGKIDTVVNAIFGALAAQDDSFAELEKRYPGIIRAILAGMRPAMLRELQRNTPLYLADLSTLYAENLTIEEIAEATAFWRSPTGTKARELILQNMRYASVAHEIVKVDSISQQGVESDAVGAVRGMARAMTPHEHGIMKAFFASPVGRKLVALNDKKLAIDTKWANYVSPAGEAEIEKIIVNSMIGYIAKTDPATARTLRNQIGSAGK